MLYYPLVEQRHYDSVRHLAEAIDIELIELQRALDNAAIERSEFAVCETVCLGEPSQKALAVLQPHSDGSVTLWVGLFGEASEDEAAVLEWTKRSAPAFAPRTVAIGVFTPRKIGNA